MLSKPEWLQWQRYCGKIGSVQHILEMMITQKHMGHYFKTIQIRMEHLMNCQLQELDLTSAQGHIIGYLAWSKQPPCAKDIEKFFGLSHPTVSGLLSRMESKGFVELRPDEQDRRMKRVVLLEKGMACSRQIHRCILENDRKMMEGFSPEETELFLGMLCRVIANMSDDAESSDPVRKE